MEGTVCQGGQNCLWMILAFLAPLTDFLLDNCRQSILGRIAQTPPLRVDPLQSSVDACSTPCTTFHQSPAVSLGLPLGSSPLGGAYTYVACHIAWPPKKPPTRSSGLTRVVASVRMGEAVNEGEQRFRWTALIKAATSRRGSRKRPTIFACRYCLCAGYPFGGGARRCSCRALSRKIRCKSQSRSRIPRRSSKAPDAFRSLRFESNSAADRSRSSPRSSSDAATIRDARRRCVPLGRRRPGGSGERRGPGR